MMISGKGAAKTVAFSPLRPKQTSSKISLDAPYQLKWPPVAPSDAEILLAELKKSLSGMKGLLYVKHRGRTEDCGKKRKKRRSRKREHKQGWNKVEVESRPTLDEPAVKKLCLETSNSVSSVGDEPSKPKSDESAEPLSCDSKKSQLVVGTNALTRSLEQGTLRVGVVCLTAKPALLHKHILQLSASRHVPVVALPNLSPTIAPLLDMKSVLAIGVKKAPEGEECCYSELVAKVTNIAPPISIPWLTSDLKDCAGEGGTKSYLELNIKRTISKPKSKVNH